MSGTSPDSTHWNSTAPQKILQPLLSIPWGMQGEKSALSRATGLDHGSPQLKLSEPSHCAEVKIQPSVPTKSSRVCPPTVRPHLLPLPASLWAFTMGTTLPSETGLASSCLGPFYLLFPCLDPHPQVSTWPATRCYLHLDFYITSSERCSLSNLSIHST